MVRTPFKLAALALLLLVALPLASAENLVAINSLDGRDVLSGIFYANAKGLPVRFMPVPGGNSQVFAAKVGSGHDVLLIQSSSLPVSGFAESDLKARDNKVEVYPTADGMQTNIELAKRSGATSFIIVDSAYSDGAISVIPYAAVTKSYVLFADRTNVDKVKEAVRGNKVIIYGYVDQAVRDGLAEFSPQAIGNGDDKYADNVALVGRLMDDYSMNRPILTDGTMIEDAIASGDSPILLTGRLVPQVTYDFVKQKVGEGKMTGVLLIGNELVYPAYDMRQRINRDLAAAGSNKTLGVMVKFAQALPGEQSGVLSLDLFRVPAYVPQLNITEIVYNKQTRKLMVGLENTGDGPLYYSSEVRVQVNGQDLRTFGSNQTSLIEQGDSAGPQYDLDLSSVPEGSVTATALVKYGASSRSLEQFATSQGSIQSITYADQSNVTVQYAAYDKEKQRVLVTIKNAGAQNAFVFTKITLTDEQGAINKISAAGIREIDPSSLYVEEFPLILSDKEVALNKEVPVSLSYGGRRDFLVKQATYVVALGQQSAAEPMQLQTAVLGAIAAALVLLVLYAAYKLLAGRKKK